MKNSALLAALALLPLAADASTAGQSAGAPPAPHKTPRHTESAPAPLDENAAKEARLGWFRDARFGMFIHWGVYSSMGNEFHGEKGVTYGEHIQRALKIPCAVYRAEVAGKFNPVKFDADAWVKLAKDAGMKYIIITAKHHDGFAMYPSKVDDFNIMDATPWKRDPMVELKAACAKHGLKFGFYYSHAFDWGTKDGPGNDWDYSNPGGDKQIGGGEWWKTMPEFLPSARGYVDRKVIPQLRELIADYKPDILWFDTPQKLPPAENRRILDMLRKEAPNTTINGRLVWGGGDYVSSCDCPLEFPPRDGDWEGIPTTNDSYGWNPFNNTHKPASHFVGLIVKAAARGGNTLLNIGPMGDGEIDPKDVSILQGLARWWSVNGESVRGTTRTPLPVQAWGQSTRKGDKLYLHVFNWPKDGRLVIGGLLSDAKNARLLGTPAGTSLKVGRLNAHDVLVEGLPAVAPDAVDSVIELEAGACAAESRRLIQSGYGADSFHVFDGQLRDAPATKNSAKSDSEVKIDNFGQVVNAPASRLKFESGAGRSDYVSGFCDPRQSIAWPVRTDRKITCEIAVDYDADQESEGGEYVIRVGGKDLPGTVTPTPGSKYEHRSRVDRLGEITLEAGEHDIAIHAIKVNGGELFRPRSIIITAKP